jgi:hypothetical protein
MVERSRRRRGMYDITETRILMTTAVFAAVAAVFAGGANARIPGEDGSNFEGQLSIAHVVSAQVPSWRGKGGKGEETRSAKDPGILSLGNQVPSWRGKGGKGEETRGATDPGVATRPGSAPTYSFPPVPTR